MNLINLKFFRIKNANKKMTKNFKLSGVQFMDNFKEEIEKATTDIFDNYFNLLGEAEVNYSGEIDFVCFKKAYYICEKFKISSNNESLFASYKDIASKFYPNRSEIEYHNNFNLIKQSVIFGLNLVQHSIQSTKK